MCSSEVDTWLPSILPLGSIPETANKITRPPTFSEGLKQKVVRVPGQLGNTEMSASKATVTRHLKNKT